jgi:D-glycero-alpha-D-manno-heptose 1-phosphate guanylyltransferase
VSTVIFLAGGLGTRLASVSKGRPKPLMEIGGRPFIEYLFDYTIEQGATRFCICVSYKWRDFFDIFGSQYKKIPILWAIEEEARGTGGAIRSAMDQFSLDEAIVLNADTLFRVDLIALQRRHRARSALLTVALRQVADTSRYGAVALEADESICSFGEKTNAGPGLINGGIYVLDRRAFSLARFPEKFSFERDFLLPHLKELRPIGVVSAGYFIDIGVPEELKRAADEVPRIFRDSRVK